MTVTLYMVGGAVRDELLGVPTKDIDFSVIITDYERYDENPFNYLKRWLIANDFTYPFFVVKPEYLTIRTRFPDGWEFAGRDCTGMVADFVISRKDGYYSDGRRPDNVTLGTLHDDLARRDFTVNALAKAEDGRIIDYFHGQADLRLMRLKAVGDPYTRLAEDALRAIRAIRFSITKNFYIGDDLWDTLGNPSIVRKLSKVDVNRRREELFKCFKHDTLRTLETLTNLGKPFIAACLADGLWLEPTLRH